MAQNTPIYKNDELTDDENSDDEKSDNFYKFISTQTQHNDALNDYLFGIGFYEKGDMPDLSENNMQQIYKLLDIKEKNTMNAQYLKNIRKIVRNRNFRLWRGVRANPRGN